MERSIQATRRPRRRPPKTFDRGRVCASDGCETILSLYNQAEHCNRHKAPTFPRIRGVMR